MSKSVSKSGLKSFKISVLQLMLRVVSSLHFERFKLMFRVENSLISITFTINSYLTLKKRLHSRPKFQSFKRTLGFVTTLSRNIE